VKADPGESRILGEDFDEDGKLGEVTRDLELDSDRAMSAFLTAAVDDDGEASMPLMADWLATGGVTVLELVAVELATSLEDIWLSPVTKVAMAVDVTGDVICVMTDAVDVEEVSSTIKLFRLPNELSSASMTDVLSSNCS